MENHQITLFEYRDYKKALMQELNNMANGFIKTGYYLKKIRDSEVYKTDGYANINEFAEKELGITRTVASRFMSINDKFSEDGYSLELKEEYKGLGSSRLSEMLTLPVGDHSMVTNVTKIEDIRAMKKFEKQEPDLIKTSHEELIRDFFNGKEKELNAVFLLVPKEAAEVINPTNNKTHKRRMLFMAMKEYEKGIEIKDLLKPVPDHLTWEEFIEECKQIFTYDVNEAGNPYQQNYKEEEKEVCEVAQSKESSERNDIPKEIKKEEKIEKKEEKTEEKEVVTEKEEEKSVHEIMEELEEEEKEEEKEVCEVAQSEENSECDTELLEGEVEKEIPFLKVHKKYFEAISKGQKRFSVRKNDRAYKAGDEYILKYIDDAGFYAIGMPEMHIRITYVLEEFEGLAEEYVAWGFEEVKDE